LYKTFKHLKGLFLLHKKKDIVMANKWLVNLARFVRSKPELSTMVAALYLALVWILAWIIIFFLSTWLIDISTSKKGFILALWLAVVAETIIRYVENIDGVAYFSKPFESEPKGDNKDFTFARMLILLFAGLTLAFFFQFLSSDSIAITESNDALFVGQKLAGRDGFSDMLANWGETLMYDGEIQLSLFLSLLFRIAIYKRKVRP
jgi:hypothetical protein